MLKLLIVAGLIYLGYSDGRMTEKYNSAQKELEQLKHEQEENKD